ncbi:MAG: tRNA epoxyqueuosine(34) reductase QueG [Planctomycetota bacterium]
MVDPQKLTETLKNAAKEMGFGLVGAERAGKPPRHAEYATWLDEGFAGEMHYLKRREAAYADPNLVLEGVRSVLMLAAPYGTVKPTAPRAGQGTISRYAWGSDYHDVVRERLDRLAALHRELAPHGHARGVVDTAPLLERAFGWAAGLGWTGRNAALIHPKHGSWFFLAGLLTTEELVYDDTRVEDSCGRCSACMKLCPTGAIVAPHVVDARLCISYLTIELRGPIPVELRAAIGNRVFGCDVCQEVCPWNRRAAPEGWPEFLPREGMNPIDLASVLEMDEAAWRARFRGMAIWRTKRTGLLRNAAIVLGNQQCSDAIPSLVRALDDPQPVIRGASAWALGRIGGLAAVDALRGRLEREADVYVRGEVSDALSAAKASERG